MSKYKEFEERVFNWLMDKHTQDPSFIFSLRKVGTAGAETDYFTGTEKSNYFGTTFWYISVAYPGNANELIGLIFKIKEQGYSYSFQFQQTKTPHNDQNKYGLDFIRLLKPIVKNHFNKYYEADPDKNKNEYFSIGSPRSNYESIDNLLKDLEIDLKELLPIVDGELANFKKTHPEFNAHKFSEPEFKNMLENYERRKANFSRSNVTASTSKPELHNESESAPPLNQILFGPPGTGKTYHTIDKALQIADSTFYSEHQDNRKELTDRFRKLLISDWRNPTGQIAFTTFHQSMSYEDFIEGIKPLPPDGNAPIQYDIVDGIFKKLCNEASRREQLTLNIDGVSSALTPERFEELYFAFSNTLPLYNETKSSVELKTKEGYPFELFRSSVNSIVVKAGAKRTNSFVSLNELRSILFDEKEPTYKSYEQIIIDKILEDKDLQKSRADNIGKNYVLVIDEINRGNISQIFGELITLVEDSKRRGQAEELSVTLPYSKKSFSVPANVFIIGTMNTADRSVEALDTALRRRFSFEEVPPRPELITPLETLRRFWLNNIDKYGGSDESYLEYESDIRKLLGIIIVDKTKYIGYGDDFESTFLKEEFEMELKNVIEFNGIDMSLILSTINQRIEKLLDKDHQIGHSYFISVVSLNDLKLAFQNKIIPLLQEYFFGDFGKIGLVLGKGFFKPVEISDENIFADFEDYEASEFSERLIYKLSCIDKMSDDDFKNAIQLLLKK